MGDDRKWMARFIAAGRIVDCTIEDDGSIFCRVAMMRGSRWEARQFECVWVVRVHLELLRDICVCVVCI